MERKPAGGPLLAFLTVEETQKKDGYIAAAMITDGRGYPLEFRATTPVRPNLVQKTLYGRQLEHFVGVELCGKTLVEQLARKPRVIVVPYRRLLSLADEVESDVVAVRSAGESISVEESGDSRVARGNFTPAGFKPVIYEARLANPDGKEALSILQEAVSRFDVFEAFDRIRSALQLLAKEDPRYA